MACVDVDGIQSVHQRWDSLHVLQWGRQKPLYGTGMCVEHFAETTPVSPEPRTRHERGISTNRINRQHSIIVSGNMTTLSRACEHVQSIISLRARIVFLNERDHLLHAFCRKPREWSWFHAASIADGRSHELNTEGSVEQTRPLTSSFSRHACQNKVALF